MFHLETAISAWRNSLRYNRTFLAEDLDELERHVRDQVATAVARGEDEEAAYRRALREMGHFDVIEKEYRKIYWGKVRRRGRLKSELIWRIQMLSNYIKIALRLLSKQKLYAVINVFGLAVGIALGALILLYVRDELSFDRHHEHADRIYRVTVASFAVDGSVRSEHPWLPYPFAEAMETDHPAVEHAIRLMDQERFLRVDDESSEERLLYADPELLSVFTFPLVEGSPETALNGATGLVISESAARRWFGNESALGRTIDIRFEDTFVPVTVTAVARDSRSNSSIRFDYLLPFERLRTQYSWIEERVDRWNASSFFVYVALYENSDVDQARSLLPTLRAKYYPNEAERRREEGIWDGEGPPVEYRLQPLDDVHLNTSVLPGLTPPSNPVYSWILAAIGLGILFIACINFTTLAIGRAASRTREIGLRKVVGANRRQLVGQFGGETVFMTVLALVFGLVLAALFLPAFNSLSGKSLTMDTFLEWPVPLWIGAMTLFVALAAGSYPSAVLSRLSPTAMFRKRARLGGPQRLTRTLVLLQFSISIALLAGTSIMARQMQFLQDRDIGYDRDHVLVAPTSGENGVQLLSRFRDALSGQPEIEGITGMTSAFSHGYSREGWNYRDEQKSAYVYRVESDFVDVMDIEVVAGRNFNPVLSTDSTRAVLVNEALVRDFGWEEPVGQILEGFYEDPEVIGVVRDLNFSSLRETVEPMVFTMDPDWGVSHVLFQIRAEAVAAALERVENTWTAVAPGVPFTYSFLDDDLASQYASDQRWTQIISYAAGFAVLIACLGLFGLASIAVAGRTKEIGIRRALGAGVIGIAARMSREFVVLVGAGVVLAGPTAWVLAERWLNGFAYRIDIGPAVFVVATLLVLGVALLTVGVQTLRAARSNPVDSLRYE